MKNAMTTYIVLLGATALIHAVNFTHLCFCTVTAYLKTVKKNTTSLSVNIKKSVLADSVKGSQGPWEVCRRHFENPGLGV